MIKTITLSFLSFLLTNPLFSQTFTKITTGDIVNDGQYSEGAYWFDYNNDNFLDLFVANIVNQNNMLFLNNGNGTFTKILSGPVVTDGGFSYGGCFGDYNNDGFPDLFVENGGSSSSQANFLYLNNAGTSFTKITTGNIVTDINGSWGSSTVDYDKDGNLDIFVSNFNQNNALYKGNGNGTFTKITTGDIVNDGGGSLGCAWGDYDNDGYPDLFVANANFGAGQNNFLYHNNGNGTFTKITTGNIVTDGGNSTGGSWGDYDNDGDLDLLVPNYSNSPNFLYRNDGGGSFTRVMGDPVVTDANSSVGSTWGDSDNDGDLDLFVANDNNQNNALYSNNGNGTFTKITTGNIVNDGGRSNGSAWGDYDNDGDIDLFVTNGDQPTVQSNFLYRNEGNSNKWVNILFKGTTSNRSAIGTRITLYAMINGNPVAQTREVFGQTGYNAQNSLNEEFGLGNAAVIDSITIKWTSGSTETFTSITPDQFYTITEGQGIVSVSPETGSVINSYRLRQNYPNPFNPSTRISFAIPQNSRSSLSIYDVNGKLIETLLNSDLKSGEYSVEWDASTHPSGVYFYKLQTGEFTQTKKMILLK